MSESIDAEILQLIGKLNKIQDEVGTVGGDKKRRTGAKASGDRFHDLKNQLIDSLSTMHESVEVAARLEKTPGSNPRELIAVQAKIRADLALVGDDWAELEALYRQEAKKRKSKLSPEEMTTRARVLGDLSTEIQGIREALRAGNVHGYTRAPLATLAESALFKGGEGEGGLPRPKGVYGQRNNDMSDGQRQQLQGVRARDALIDEEIVKIGQGIDELHEIAMAQNEEVKLQNAALNILETKVDAVHDKVFNVNERLKDTIEQVRSSDKICLDICCILILVGMLVVVIKTTTNA